MFIGMVLSRLHDKVYSFLFYLLIGNLVMLAFWHMLNRYFAIPPSEASIPNPKVQSKTKLESTEQTSSDKEISDSSEVENMPVHELPTMTYWQNFKVQYGVHIGLLMCYFTTLLIFPVLIFRIGLAVSPEYKYLLFTLFFNLGDVVGRLGYNLQRTTNRYLIHVLSLVKLMFIPLYYLLSKNPNLISQGWVRSFAIFLFALFHGFICTAYFNISTSEFSQKHDRYRAGNLSSMALIIGLTLGGVSSFIWY